MSNPRKFVAVSALASALAVASCGVSSAAPVQHYGYDFHVSTNNELESLAQTSYQQVQPHYVRAPPTRYQTPGVYRQGHGIIRQHRSGDPSTGNWSWGYETENGISFTEEGHLQSPSDRSQYDDSGPFPVVRGQYSYTGPNGVVYRVEYYADDTGFHPSGAHLPGSIT